MVHWHVRMDEAWPPLPAAIFEEDFRSDDPRVVAYEAARDREYMRLHGIEAAVQEAVDEVLDRAVTPVEYGHHGRWHAAVPFVEDETGLLALLESLRDRIAIGLGADATVALTGAVGIGDDYIEAYHRGRETVMRLSHALESGGRDSWRGVSVEVAHRHDAHELSARLPMWPPRFGQDLADTLGRGPVTLVATAVGPLLPLVPEGLQRDPSIAALRAATGQALRAIAGASGQAYWIDDDEQWVICPDESPQVVAERVAAAGDDLVTRTDWTIEVPAYDHGEFTVDAPELTGMLHLRSGIAHAGRGSSPEQLKAAANAALTHHASTAA